MACFRNPDSACICRKDTNCRLIEKIVMRGIRVPLKNGAFDYDAAALSEAAKKLKTIRIKYPYSRDSFAVFKKSVDARKKNEIYFVYSVIFSVSEAVYAGEREYSDFSLLCQKHDMAVIDNEKPIFDSCGAEFGAGSKRPVVAGFGPCGMFAALVLAKAGLCPVVVERGSDVEKRAAAVERYWKSGILDAETNVQFGEGGAGTFSDGKLMTRINDGLCSYVLDSFFEYGADKNILVDAKPHVGTDRLQKIVKNIRNDIISLGGEVHFGACLKKIIRRTDGSIKAVCTTAGDFETDTLFLAVGHSARDTFSMLSQQQIELCAKPFSVGVRIEHLQKNINRALYGENFENPALPQGEYSLSRQFGDHAVYSFCMCPGGTVVASASENETIVTNGMSYSARSGVNANSAIAVSVNCSDFGGGVFEAIDFQRRIEKAAFALAGANGAAPIENLGHFLGEKPLEITEVLPTYTGKTQLCGIGELFPEWISSLLKKGILAFENRIGNFASDSAVLTAPETRTSSPVRIPRNSKYESERCPGLYPCGEGAGYAGGITSAAVDGIRCAISYIEKISNNPVF